MTVRLRQCGNPECRICAHNEPGEPPDSGHPVDDERLATMLIGAAAIVLGMIVAFLLAMVL